VGEKGGDFGLAQRGRVTLIVEDAEREAFDPIHVGGLGVVRVVFGPQGVSDLIEQFFRRRRLHRPSEREGSVLVVTG